MPVKGKHCIIWVKNYPALGTVRPHTKTQAKGFYDNLDGTKTGEKTDATAQDAQLEQKDVGTPPPGRDASFAEKADILYFSGIGDDNAPRFGNTAQDDGRARPEEIRLGNAGVGLKWLVLDACWSVKINAISRWADSFEGLHQILGFRKQALDEPYRGKYFAQDLNAGYSIREAWELAVEETEDNPYWAHLTASSSGADAADDHWIGKGTVSAKPEGDLEFEYIYLDPALVV